MINIDNEKRVYNIIRRHPNISKFEIYRRLRCDGDAGAKLEVAGILVDLLHDGLIKHVNQISYRAR